jgi:hypothetical protein
LFDGVEDMKYCYCPNCDNLRPKSWYLRSRCERCQGECIEFNVKRSTFGILMYFFYALAGIMVVLYMGKNIWHSDWANIISSVPQQTFLILMIAFLVIGLVFSFIDVGKMNVEAEKVRISLKQDKAKKSP